MESINDCFLLEKELRGVVQKGMRGNVGAVEYLEEVGSGPGVFLLRQTIDIMCHFVHCLALVLQ